MGSQREVRVCVPVDSAFVAVLRSTAATLAARLDLSLEDIEDLRIAVGEACGIMLLSADPAANVECTFTLHDRQIVVDLATPASRSSMPPEDSFAWQVLSALTSDSHMNHDDGRLRVRLIMRAEEAG